MYDFLKAGFSDEGSAFLLQFFALRIILQGDYIEFLVFSDFIVILLSINICLI